MNVCVVYYNFGEAPKVAKKIEELFKAKKIDVESFQVEVEEKNLKKQFKQEKKLELIKQPIVKDFDLIVIGTPIVSFTSVPAINVFIRNLKNKNKGVVLFATGIGLPGKAIKKMSSLLSMNEMKVIDSKVFSSIFEFDSRKLKEVEVFFERFFQKI